MTSTLISLLLALFFLALPRGIVGFHSSAPCLQSRQPFHKALTIRKDFPEGTGPSDYDSADLLPTQKEVTVDENEEDEEIREELKRELLLLASVTNRGEYASADERNIVIDLVTQLEALNPTPQPAFSCQGDWDLCLSSTQFFRSSPFFQSLRVTMDDATMASNAFDLHDLATSISRVGRVRQSVESNQRLVSEVDLEVGFFPGLPFQVKGTVITTAKMRVVSDQKWELQVDATKVKGSNIPIFNQILEENLHVELPIGEVYNTLQGQIPIVPMTTLYVDDSMRITRDIDENFFVFTRP